VTRGGRNFDRAALLAFAPVVAVSPVWLAAMALFWLPVGLMTDIPYWWFPAIHLAAGLGLFVPVMQRRLLTALVGARKPDEAEAAALRPAFREVVQALHLRNRHFVVGVVDDDALNAFACGGHLVVVTSFAARSLSHDALCGVLAHEICHHLGSHTVANTFLQWLTLPVTMLARIGAFLRNVAIAATDAFGRGSRVADIVGRTLAFVFLATSWFFNGGFIASRTVANVVSRSAEFNADQRVVSMGYGRQLAEALRLAAPGEHRSGRRFSSHPPARTRIARIEGTLRRPTSRQPRRHPSTGLT
jgi:Zn-dependent protease with chaperone function